MQEPSEKPFNIAAVSKEAKPLTIAEKKKEKKAQREAAATGAHANGVAPAVSTSSYESLLNAIPEFASIGKLFKVGWQVLACLNAASLSCRKCDSREKIFSFQKAYEKLSVPFGRRIVFLLSVLLLVA